MIGVDLIGEIRRAYFEQQRPIKEIVRTLSVSRATVRKVIRSRETEFKYERGLPVRLTWASWGQELLLTYSKIFPLVCFGIHGLSQIA